MRINISKLYLFAVLVIFLGVLGGCAILKNTSRHYQWTHFSNHFITIDSTIVPDSAVSAELLPYRKRVDKVMDKVIGKSTGTFLKNKPEGSLGDLVADAVRTEASNILERNVNIGVITSSSIKYRLPQGDITRGMIYDIMPYNSKLVIFKLKGSDIQKLADEIAKAGGEPESGLRMQINGKKVTGLLIGQNTLNPDQIYFVATSDYLANGGGNLPALWNPVKRLNESISIRKCIDNYISNRGEISPSVDGRVR